MLIAAVAISCGSGSEWGDRYGDGPAKQYEPCPDTIVLDGAFTGFERGCKEWNNKPVEGAYGVFQGDRIGNRLFLVNDWSPRTVALEPDMYHQYRMLCDGVQMEVRIYADNTVEVRRDGALDDQGYLGAAGFAASPYNSTPHAIFEFSMLIPEDLKECYVTVSAPDNGSGTTPEEALLTDPVGFRLKFDGTCNAHIWPMLIASSASKGHVGDLVTFTGINFNKTGTLSFVGGSATVPAKVLSWNDEEIAAFVPPIMGQTGVRVTNIIGTSNWLPFEVDCKPDCNGAYCGTDGCGGSCGTCQPGTTCDINRQCIPYVE